MTTDLERAQSARTGGRASCGDISMQDSQAAVHDRTSRNRAHRAPLMAASVSSGERLRRARKVVWVTQNSRCRAWVVDNACSSCTPHRAVCSAGPSLAAPDCFLHDGRAAAAVQIARQVCKQSAFHRWRIRSEMLGRRGGQAQQAQQAQHSAP